MKFPVLLRCAELPRCEGGGGGVGVDFLPLLHTHDQL